MIKSSMGWLLAGAMALGCGEGEATETAPSQDECPEVHSPFAVSNGILWRGTDGDWLVRVRFSARNDGSTPFTLRRAGILADELTAWEPLSSLPERVLLPPGEATTGDLVYYYDGSSAARSVATLSYGPFEDTVHLTRVPVPPPAGADLEGPVTGEVAVRADGTATRWRDPDDNSHVVRVPLVVTNGVNIPVELTSRDFVAIVNGVDGTFWSTPSTLPDPLVLEPGETWEGMASWYYAAESEEPAEVRVRIGSPQEPLAEATVAVEQGSAP